MNKIIFLFLILVGLTAQSQSYGVTEKGFGIVNPERHQFKFDLFSPGISYELGIIKNVSASGGLGLGYATYEEGYAVGVTLHTRVRYYHNFNRRIRNNKNVSGNSGDYFAAARSIFFSQGRLATNIEGPNDFNLGVYGPVYGIQRTYPKGFNFNVELGAVYYRGDGVPNGYGPLVNFTFGWVATKRKSSKPVFD
ncbi:hypothetical protein NYZ99_04310 [Maribacter litopenaei]|uniref:Outer membrane protein beta-barrel domain-containing protein n=1 Tax=Maribacter litopenaei TaxID=2976127 RepID=A0ABY5YBT6_9FLAO|nr:hypothetical protein [Maribacter litopenaei]UWX55679.1 hypothetical protein NYZ99_04310 [Maribacter litopenaei]